MFIESELSGLHYRDVNLTTINTQARLLSGTKFLRGKQKESWTDGPPKGVGLEGEFAPSHGKLKHSLLLGFTKSHLCYTLDP